MCHRREEIYVVETSGCTTLGIVSCVLSNAGTGTAALFAETVLLCDSLRECPLTGVWLAAAGTLWFPPLGNCMWYLTKEISFSMEVRKEP